MNITHLNELEAIRINVRDSVVRVLRENPKIRRIQFSLAPMQWALLEEEMLAWKHPLFELVSENLGVWHMKWQMGNVEIRVFMDTQDLSDPPILRTIREQW